MRTKTNLSLMCMLLVLTSHNAWSNINQHIKSLRNKPHALYSLLKTMPKGGELHYHFDGSVYAENMLEIASEGNYCLERNSFSSKHCEHKPSVQSVNALNHAVKEIDEECHLKEPETPISTLSKACIEKTIRAWSMKGINTRDKAARDHFFSAFSKLWAIQDDFRPHLLSKIIQKAAAQHELYLEIIAITLNSHHNYSHSSNFDKARKELLANTDFQKDIQGIVKEAKDLSQNTKKILGCKVNPELPECTVEVKFQFFVKREAPADVVFTEALAGFEAIKRSPYLVGINLVNVEDGPFSMRDYRQHMKIFHFLHRLYPKVHISLHAGEFPLSKKRNDSHIHDAIFIGAAERIGHGLDIKQERHAKRTLREMASKPVVVEVNLTSNRLLYDVTDTNHPLQFYLNHQIPLVLSTDDEGILRTNLSEQYLEAIQRYHLDYKTIKQINRNTLTYAFLPGRSIWKRRGVLVTPCKKLTSVSCKAFIQHSQKAKLQWTLENQLHVFESRFNK